MAFPRPPSPSAILIAACLSLANEAIAAEGNSKCRFDLIGNATTVAVTDARSFRLADGREVKLAGVDVPGGRQAAMTRAALENLVLGKDLVVRAPSDGADRYGRVAAFAFVNGSETPVQYNLLALGQARVSAQVEDKACSMALLAEEKRAREGRIGLWADPGYAVRAAEDGPAIRAQRGRFSVAEGRVVSVRDSGGTIYVNFGRRWSEALTVTILKRHERSFAAAGIEPRNLQGRAVRIRGYVDVRNGPMIEATRPQQIEIAAR